MKTSFLAASAALTAVLAFGVASSAMADTVAFNSAPTDGFHYGTGNDYSPANALVLDTSGGDELALRFHVRGEAAPAAAGNVYNFAKVANQKINFDWSFDSNMAFDVDNSTLVLTLDRLGAGGGTASYDAFFVGNDNHFQNGSYQNSFQLGFAAVNGGPFGDINFDPTVDATYRVNLAFNNGTTTKQLNAYAVIGNGSAGITPGGAVPEPATWSLMITGFGAAGAMLRRRQKPVLTTAG